MRAVSRFQVNDEGPRKEGQGVEQPEVYVRLLHSHSRISVLVPRCDLPVLDRCVLLRTRRVVDRDIRYCLVTAYEICALAIDVQ